jgi:aspartate kinase
MSSPNVRVEKIGGTSMTRFAACLENIILRDTNDVYDRVMTVSAYGGVTNALLEHKKTGAPGIYKKFADQTTSSVVSIWKWRTSSSASASTAPSRF